MIEKHFGVPIFVDKCSSSNMFNTYQDEIRTEILKAIENKQDLSNPWNDTVNTSFKYTNKQQFLDNTPEFKKYVLNCMAQFCPFPVKEIKITESWFNVSQKGGFQHFHCHPINDISGTYYFQTSGEDGDIKFQSDSSALKNSIFCSLSETSFRPEVGMLLLFPSYLEHAVMLNKTNNDRISITFNAKVVTLDDS